jgi:hypothetical protein
LEIIMATETVAKLTVFAFSLNGAFESADDMVEVIQETHDDLIIKAFVDDETRASYDLIECSQLNNRFATRTDLEDAIPNLRSHVHKNEALELVAKLQKVAPYVDIDRVISEITGE